MGNKKEKKKIGEAVGLLPIPDRSSCLQEGQGEKDWQISADSSNHLAKMGWIPAQIKNWTKSQFQYLAMKGTEDTDREAVGAHFHAQ